MADITLPELPSGAGGTREKFAKIATYVGAGIAGFGAFLVALQAAGVVDGWIPFAMMVLGVVTKLGAWLGYFKSETTVKVEALKAGAAAAQRIQTPQQAAAALRTPP